MKHFLVSDARERDVNSFLVDMVDRSVLKIKQITVGDFNVCCGSKVVSCFERKTFKDFGASLKDGRYGNIDKMVALREETGCALVYIVEGGPLVPAPTRDFARIPYKNIEAAWITLMVRHGVQVVRTEDPRDTARILGILLAKYESEAAELRKTSKATKTPVKKSEIDSSASDEASASAEARSASSGPADRGEVDVVSGTAEDDEAGYVKGEIEGIGVPASLTKCAEQSPLDQTCNAWARLKGVSLPQARKLVELFSLAEVARGKVPDAQLAGVKNQSGRGLHRNALASLRKLTKGDVDTGSRVLAVKGVTKAVAMALLKVHRLSAIASFEPKALAITVVGTRKTKKGNVPRKLGDAAAKRIIEVLNFKL